MKILFVCLGNICRSPLAEAIFDFKIGSTKKENFFFTDSCALSNYHIGCSPDSRVMDIAHKHNIEINHRAREINSNDFETFDYILVMDRNNYSAIKQLEGAHMSRAKIFLIRHFDFDKSDDEVPDPYYGDKDDFQKVFDMLNRSIEGFIDYLKKQNLF